MHNPLTLQAGQNTKNTAGISSMIIEAFRLHSPRGNLGATFSYCPQLFSLFLEKEIRGYGSIHGGKDNACFNFPRGTWIIFGASIEDHWDGWSIPVPGSTTTYHMVTSCLFVSDS